MSARVRRPPELTTRQREMLLLMAEGHVAKTAAAELGITLNTAKEHLRHARWVLRARTTTHAVAILLNGRQEA